jgi:hypothetical protein
VGCGIYAERPAACRNWWCQWLGDNRFPKAARMFRDDERPDRCGVMFDVTADATLVAYEVWPGAFEGAAELLERAARGNRLVRVPFA